MRSPPWNDTENGAIVALYFAMLDKAISGQHYNKAAMIRLAQGIDQPDQRNEQERTGQLEARSRPSIEMKLMNCTAAHQAIDPTGTTMNGYGYRAMPNMQAALKAAVLEGIQDRQLDADILTSAANERRAGA